MNVCSTVSPAIEAELASGAGGAAFVKLSREHAELSPVIQTARDYRATQTQLEETDALIADPATDNEMKSLAEQERAELRQRLTALDQTLKIQLLPKDAADNSSAIIEIRAGTGGDEAALFAGDLLGMYQRYCNLQGWKTELLSLSESDLGGFKEATPGSAGPRRLCQAEIRKRRAPRPAGARHRKPGAASTLRRRRWRCCRRRRTSML